MKRYALILSFVVVGVGCSKSTNGAGGTTSSASGTTSSKSASSTATGGGCAMPGDMGNAQGVGHYCTKGGNECTKFPLAGACLLDLGQDQAFCTRIGCSTQADCGQGAGCHLDPLGSACVPCKCDDTAVGCGTSTSSSSSSSSSASGSTSSASSTSSGG